MSARLDVFRNDTPSGAYATHLLAGPGYVANLFAAVSLHDVPKGLRFSVSTAADAAVIQGTADARGAVTWIFEEATSARRVAPVWIAAQTVDAVLELWGGVLDWLIAQLPLRLASGEYTVADPPDPLGLLARANPRRRR